MHDVKIVAISKMQLGFEEHGLFDPFKDKQDLSNNGICEAADSYNYSKMEYEKILCLKNISTEDKEELLQMLDNIASASLLLGIQWCEYEQALKERMKKNGKNV